MSNHRGWALLFIFTALMSMFTVFLILAIVGSVAGWEKATGQFTLASLTSLLFAIICLIHMGGSGDDEDGKTK